MYMAGYTNRQNEANPAIYPATLGGQKNSQKI